MLLNKAHEDQKRLVEIDGIREEHQQTIEAYQDQHQDEHGI